MCTNTSTESTMFCDDTLGLASASRRVDDKDWILWRDEDFLRGRRWKSRHSFWFDNNNVLAKTLEEMAVLGCNNYDIRRTVYDHLLKAAYRMSRIHGKAS